MTHSLRFAAALGVVALCTVSAHAREEVGTLRVVRYVSVREGGKAVAARSGAKVSAGAELITGRRSYVETTVKVGYLRLDERSRATLTDGEAIQLAGGAAFVKGTLRIGTEGANISVSDGTAVIKILSPGITRVSALGGAVEVEQDEARVVLKVGETITMERVASRRLRGTPAPIPSGDLPSEAGGALTGWWHRIEIEDGLMVFPGSQSALRLRTDPITEAVSDIAAIPPTPQSLAENAGRRNTLLGIAVARINPTLDAAIAAEPALTLATYRQRFALDYTEDRFTQLTRSDKDFLRGNGIQTVDQLFTALSASGSGFGSSVPQFKTEYKIFDRNVDKSTYAVGGALAMLLTGGSAKWSAPRASAAGYGFLSDPQALGLRGELDGSAGKTRYHLEANTLNLTGGTQDPSNTDALSQAVVERELSGGLSVFAGRQRFYEGPLLQNQSRGQLLADRYTGVGIRQRSGKSVGEVALLHDANPDRRGAQAGALASLTTQNGGGLIGFHVLNAAKVTGGGTGFTVSFSQPFGPFDGYGEVGKSLDGRSVATVGVYLASAFQKTGIDTWIEAGTNPAYGDALSLGLAKTQNDLTWRAFGTLNKPNGRGQNGKWGFGAVYRYR
jgi:hypothetical protein